MKGLALGDPKRLGDIVAAADPQPPEGDGSRSEGLAAPGAAAHLFEPFPQRLVDELLQAPLAGFAKPLERSRDIVI